MGICSWIRISGDVIPDWGFLSETRWTDEVKNGRSIRVKVSARTTQIGRSTIKLGGLRDLIMENLQKLPVLKSLNEAIMKGENWTIL